MFLPLQGQSPFGNSLIQPDTSITTYLILGGAVLALVLLIVIGNAVSGGGQDKNSRRFSKRQFRREGLKIGLTKNQVELLLTLIRVYNIVKPFDLLLNSRTLNNTIGKALRDIDNMDAPLDVIERRKLDLYRIKQRLERMHVQTNRLDSTRQLKLGQKITFKLVNTQRYATVITANLKEFFCARVPKNSGGEQIRWKKGYKVDVLLWNKDGEEQLFETKVIGYNNIKGVSSVLLSHTNRIKRTYTRRYRRKSIKINCQVYPIKIIMTGIGRRAKKDAVVQNSGRRLMAMTDLSAGGCRLQTSQRVPRGELVKLNFEPERGKPVVALGKVVDVNPSGRMFYNLHVMFTRASSKNLNRINEYIYDFS